MKSICSAGIIAGIAVGMSLGISETAFGQVRSLPPHAPRIAMSAQAAPQGVPHAPQIDTQRIPYVNLQRTVPQGVVQNGVMQNGAMQNNGHQIGAPHNGAAPPIMVMQPQPPMQSAMQPGMQSVQFRLPQGALYSFASGTEFAEPTDPLDVIALHVGPAYRFRISNIPYNEERELFPSIRLLGRIHPPQGREARFPIVVDLTQEDLELALNGKLVTRVVYLEDPERALPLNVKEGPISQDVAPGANPFVIAETLGRPIAVVQVGARVPDQNGFYNSPDWQFLGQPAQEIYPETPVQPDRE